MFSPLRRNLRTSTAEGLASSITVGIGETYLPVFVLVLSGSQLACGLVSTLPLVAGAALQMVSPRWMRYCGSYRRWVAACAVVQAVAFIPLVIAAYTGHMRLAVVFALVAVYWATGLGGSGAWNAWMETLVPSRVRARYFAWRTRICQWGIAIGFLVGGVALQIAGNYGTSPIIFTLLFAVAAISRLISAMLLARQSEPQKPPESRSMRPLASAFQSLTAGANGRLLLYLLSTQAAVQISGPYFSPFMLGELHFSYATFASIICAATVAKILFLPTVGRIVDRVGSHRVLTLSGAGIVISPALWLVSHSVGYLLAVQVYSGMVWCAFDLATLLLFIETIPRHKRVEVLTVFNLANSAATAGGSLAGGAILALMGANHQAYLALFALSAVARGAAIALLVRVPAATTPRPHSAPAPAVPIHFRAAPARGLAPAEIVR